MSQTEYLTSVLTPTLLSVLRTQNSGLLAHHPPIQNRNPFLQRLPHHRAPAKPSTVRGYSANLILTEFAFHDDPEAIWKAIFPSISNPLRGGPKKLRIISTPNGQGNYFHELWTNSKIFSRHKITIHDAVDQKLPIDIAALKAGLLDPEAWAQEYECEFADQSSVLLPYELIEGCEAAEAVEANSVEGLSRSFAAEVHGTPELFLGIDFGRKQDLTVCWVLERMKESKKEEGGIKNGSVAGKDSFMTREVLVMRRMPTPEQIELLRPRVNLARAVCVDYTGAGVGLGDALRKEFGGQGGVVHVHGGVEGGDFCEVARGDGAASGVDPEERGDSGGSAFGASGGIEHRADYVSGEPERGWAQRSFDGARFGRPRGGEQAGVGGAGFGGTKE